MCVCLRKFLVNCSGSFCFIVLQNQSPRFLLTIPGRRKIFKTTHLFESSPNFSGTYSRILCICLRKFLLYQESNYSVIYWQFLEGKKIHSSPSSRIIFKFLQNIIWSIVRLSAKISWKSVQLFFFFYCTKKSITPSFIDNFWKEKTLIATKNFILFWHTKYFLLD